MFEIKQMYYFKGIWKEESLVAKEELQSTNTLGSIPEPFANVK